MQPTVAINNETRIVYVNEKKEIIAIVSSEIESFAHYEHYAIRYDEIKDIIEGRTGMTHYTVSPHKDDPLRMCVVKKNYEIDSIRRLDNFLTEVRKNLDIVPHITVQNFIKSKRIRVTMNKKTRKGMLKNKPNGSKVSFKGISNINLHFTTKNDPSVLFFTAEIKLAQLLRQGSADINYDVDLDDVSVFTKKIFPNYVYEVLDE